MFDHRNNNLKKLNAMFAAAAVFTFLVTGCSLNSAEESGTTEETASVTESAVPENDDTQNITEMTASLADEEQDSAEAVVASPVLNVVSEDVPYTTDISDLFTERDLRTEYEITEKINLDEITDSVLTITGEGVYELSGKFSGQIRIKSEGKVQLVLNQAEITCPDGSAVYVEDAKKVFITLAENSENTLSDGTGYSDETTDGAVIWSADSLTVNGSGILTINAGEDEGITCKDDLVIAGGTINVNAVGNGIKGKDYVAVYDGTVNITAGGDGLKSSNATDTGMGFIYIKNGSFSIQAEEDGIQAESELIIENGDFNITSGGGTANAPEKHDDFGGFGKGGFNMQNTETADTESDTVSVKGMKAGSMLYLSGGSLTLNTADDGLHSNGSLYIAGGSLNLAAGDKGLHADTSLTISDGNINISQSYEGIEAADILVSGGTVRVKSSDDGFNASDGTEQGAMGTASDCSLEISGGYVYVNADGDGLDSNGNLTVSGGTVLADGPTNDGNGALDSNGGITVTGGFLLAAGSSGMAEYPDEASQNVIVITLDYYQNADTLVTICDQDGNEIISYTPSKQFNSVVFSSEALESGKEYTLYLGGTSTASQENGLYETGSYQKDGTESGSVTLEDSVSFIGTAKSMGMGGGMMGGRGGFGGQMPENMELPTDENGEITMPEDFDPSQMQGGRGGFGGQMPENFELPTDENGDIDRSQFKNHNQRPDNFGQDRTQQTG
ncbi:MAG: carbohydrate-binding domain-containing protein [Oscillospiraceae bacterium]|nr:carbohydrate-binding domain-containing protein [Oscillospiraceae bacterium]